MVPKQEKQVVAYTKSLFSALLVYSGHNDCEVMIAGSRPDLPDRYMSASISIPYKTSFAQLLLRTYFDFVIL